MPVEPSPIPDYSLDPTVLLQLRCLLDQGFRKSRDQLVRSQEIEQITFCENAKSHYKEFEKYLALAGQKQLTIDSIRAKPTDETIQMIEKIVQSPFWKYSNYDGDTLRIDTRDSVVMKEVNVAAGVNRSVDLGYFQVQMNPVSGRIICVPLKDNVKALWRGNGGQCYHPFLSPEHKICWGTGADLSVRLINERKFDRLLEMLAGILTSQEVGANPYVPLVQLEEARKSQCKHCRLGNSQCVCSKCRLCAKKEGDCSCNVCEHCEEKFKEGTRCESCVCSICDEVTAGNCDCCHDCGKEEDCECKTCAYCGNTHNDPEKHVPCECPFCHQETRGTCRCFIDHDRTTERCLNCGDNWSRHDWTLCRNGSERFVPAPSVAIADRTAVTINVDDASVSTVPAGVVVHHGNEPRYVLPDGRTVRSYSQAVRAFEEDPNRPVGMTGQEWASQHRYVPEDFAFRSLSGIAPGADAPGMRLTEEGIVNVTAQVRLNAGDLLDQAMNRMERVAPEISIAMGAMLSNAESDVHAPGLVVSNPMTGEHFEETQRTEEEYPF